MINYPHAFYLKYFLGKQINCFIWNYRGYGRTKGKPDPMQFENDAEQVLDYLKNTIGVTGKIGVYGRSLGCIPATHL
jgi:alpha/beta superfamily hydrolase